MMNKKTPFYFIGRIPINQSISIYLISIYFVRRINNLRKKNSIKKCHRVKWKGRFKKSPLHIEGLWHNLYQIILNVSLFDEIVHKFNYIIGCIGQIWWLGQLMLNWILPLFVSFFLIFDSSKIHWSNWTVKRVIN